MHVKLQSNNCTVDLHTSTLNKTTVNNGKSNIRIKLHLILLLILNCFYLFVPHGLRAEYDIKSVAPILDSAEKFFISIKNSEYNISWNLLSKETRQTIVEDVHKSYKKMGGTISKDIIMTDFNTGGSMFNNYWNAFAKSFDPDMILENSRWEIGYLKKEKAEINITYKKSKNPAKLIMYKENGAWKVGLAETFWTRKYQ